MPDQFCPDRLWARCGDACAGVLARLESLFGEMARSYDRVAQAHGFFCQGCQESCCRTLFYHHTLAEVFYLHQGLDALGETALSVALERAGEVVRAMAHGETGLWCPLCADGRCLVYGHRPMICRLHGIPHELHHPARGVIQGPGCAAFDAAIDGPIRQRLDRTPLYRAMAELEGALRQATGYDRRIRMTVADMVLCFRPGAIGSAEGS